MQKNIIRFIDDSIIERFDSDQEIMLVIGGNGISPTNTNFSIYVCVGNAYCPTHPANPAGCTVNQSNCIVFAGNCVAGCGGSGGGIGVLPNLYPC